MKERLKFYKMTRNRLIPIAILLIIKAVHSTVDDNVTTKDDINAPSNIIRGDRLTPFHPIQHQISVIADDQFCGGTILDDWHVLTAAHCIIKLNGIPANKIHVGTNKTIHANTTNMTIVDMVYVPRQRLYSCLEYRPNEDIAVLKLNESLDLSTSLYMDKIKLPELQKNDVYNSYEGRIAMIAGYGISDVEIEIDRNNQVKMSNIVYPHTLQVARVRIIPQAECQKIWSPTRIRSTMLCGRIRGSGYRGVCNNDNGNGLIYLETVIGVMSFSSGLCYEGNSAKGRPAVYTRVTAFVPFIENVLQNNVSEDDGVCGLSLQEKSTSGVESFTSIWSLIFTSIVVTIISTV